MKTMLYGVHNQLSNSVALLDKVTPSVFFIIDGNSTP